MEKKIKEKIGEIVWWSVRKPGIDREKLLDITEKFALPENLKKHIPNEIRPRDAFRRASKIKESITIEFQGDEYKVNLFVREIETNTNYIKKKLIQEIIDDENDLISYKVVADITFNDDEDGYSIDYEISQEFKDDYDYERLLGKIQDKYDKNLKIYHANAIRKFIREMVNELDSFQAAPRGGIYFISSESQENLDKIDAILNEIDKYSKHGRRDSDTVFFRLAVDPTSKEIGTTKNIYKQHVNNTLLKWERKIDRTDDEDMEESIEEIKKEIKFLKEEIQFIEKKLGTKLPVRPLIDGFLEDITGEESTLSEDSKKDIEEVIKEKLESKKTDSDKRKTKVSMTMTEKLKLF